MSGMLLLLIAITVLVLGYKFYGSFVEKMIGVDPKRETPAHTLQDDIDYIPTKGIVLFGHHFSSIAGASPIIGPIIAITFGWLPAIIWILFGGVFLGAVHDFTSLMASVKHQGKGIGEIIEDEIGHAGKMLFLVFTWLTLVLIVAVFASIVAKSFVASPSSASASSYYIVLAVLFGLALKAKMLPFNILTIIGVVLLFAGLAFGQLLPLSFGVETWIALLLIYATVASLLPVWILLQPRDYLSSFLLYSLILLAVVGILFYNPHFKMPMIGEITKNHLGSLFPFLFITIACGAISGFHSIVASGTTSKQLNNEREAKPIAFGGMLVESLLAVVAIFTAGFLGVSDYSKMLVSGGPISIFSNGIAHFSQSLGLPFDLVNTFAVLAISAFALTTLDTSSRLAMYSWQEFFSRKDGKKSLFNNRYIAVTVTAIPAAYLAMSGMWKAIWPLFGAANQLLAALALLTGYVWLKSHKKGHLFFIFIPMIFMYTVTTTALVIMGYRAIIGRLWLQSSLSLILLTLAITLLIIAVRVMKMGKKAI